MNEEEAKALDRRQALLAKFRDSTRTRVHKLSSSWARLLDGKGKDPESVAALMREIHTIKGESRLMGYATMNGVAHEVEVVLTRLRSADFHASAADSDLVLAGLDILADLASDDATPSGERARRAAEFLGQDGASAITLNDDDAAASAPVELARGDDLFRVEGGDLSDLTDRTASLLRRREMLDRVVTDLARVASDLARQNAGPKVGALIKELSATIARAQDEGFENRLEIVELQESVRRLRMVEVATLFEQYPPAARQLGRELHKKVRVVVDDGQVSIDKQVADQLHEPLVHLLRNAVDHGLESPEQRRARGKPEAGEISLRARTVGGQVEITLSDDGGGLDPVALRKTAIARGLLDADAAARLDDVGAFELIFAPDFSTRTTTTDVSGRGVGLDVVKRSIERMGGVVRVHSVHKHGCTFTLRVPVSLALVRALVFASDTGLFAVPSTAVMLVSRLHDDEVQVAGDGAHVQMEGGARVPMVDLQDIVGLPRAAAGESTAIFIDDGVTQVVLRVGRVLGELQLVKQPLDPFLAGGSLVNGTAILDGGRHCFFLQVSAMARRAARRSSGSVRPSPSPGQERRRRVLIVDDSEITRDMLVSLLQRRGFDTVEAVDGKDALEKAARTPPDIVLTDLDMPVLDGVGLVKAMRAESALQGLPIIVLSTRGSSSDKERAMNAGASGYLVKSSFKESDLVDAFRQFLRGTS
jgi:chemotaxis protein histidine kinase CheA/CheY-like chemotaxis protein